MLLVCRCGFTKSSHPYKSAAIKRMLCEKCKPWVRIIFVGRHRIEVVLKRPRDGIGRRPGLKIPGR